MNQKKEEASNRLKQRLQDRKNKNQNNSNSLLLSSTSLPNLPPPPPSSSSSSPLSSTITTELTLDIIKHQQKYLSKLIEELVTFSPALFLNYEQYYFLTQNHMYNYLKSKHQQKLNNESNNEPNDN